MHVAMSRRQDCKEKHCYENTVSVALDVVCAASSGTGEDCSRDSRPFQVSDFKILCLPSGVSAAVHGGQGTWVPKVVL